jgi:hypothetical protein
VENVSGNAPQQLTAAKLLWNQEYLYVAFKCHDDFVYASYQGFNDRLYEEEVVEVFIDDNRDLKTYLEFEVNPLNAVLHYSLHHNLRGQFLKFARVDNRLITAVVQEPADQIWNVEIAIPFAEFVTARNIPPQPGDTWLLNLYRIDRPRNGEAEYSAWSPTKKINFHLPECFGELIFTN